METDTVAETSLNDFVAGFCTFFTVIFLRGGRRILYLTTHIQQCEGAIIKGLQFILYNLESLCLRHLSFAVYWVYMSGLSVSM